MTDWTLPGYTELRELGTGSFGRVVLARHEGSGTLVAIKYLSVGRLGGEWFLSRFREEARTLAALHSPYVTRLYEYAESGTRAAIVMEAVSGASLRAVLEAHGPTVPEAALAVLKGSLLGLGAAHAAGIVHRDYKPENVLVQENGQSKIADFGVAIRSGHAGVSAGSPGYMAPEQWTGGPAAPSTDVYAATCVFFECLTGRRPYGSADQATLEQRHLTAPVPAMEVPEPVRPLVLRGMAKDPSDRPASALDFVRELEWIAAEAYGHGWERTGRSHLVEVAATLAALSPLAIALGTGSGGGGGAAGGG
ncbi:serine/threonine-protein kinase, partial [Actinoallomurus acaciae]